MMIATNPFAEFRVSCEKALQKALKKLFPKVIFPSTLLESPPSPEFGELASSVCFDLAKQLGKKPNELAEQIVKAINLTDFPLVQSIEAAGEGYVNFHANLSKLATATFQSVRKFGSEYGFVKTEKPQKIIVEHTSKNPFSPVNVGQARNPILGDSIAKILKAQGNVVYRHFYVDDVGRQTAVMAYGYERLGKPKLEGKPDHQIGAIYTVTSCIIEVNRLRREIEKAKQTSALEEVYQYQKQLDEWVSVASELENKFPTLFTQLLEKITEKGDLESEVSRLNCAYERGDDEAKQLIREVCQLCLNGIKGTLEKVNIFLDSFDWESDLVWSGEVTKTLEKLKKTPYVFQMGNVLEFNAEKVAQDFDLKKAFDLSEEHEIPSLTLVRADGTTLYTTRDIPYTLLKFKKADKVINVIGVEQSLSQLQLKLALYALGYGNLARNLTHSSYNLVSLSGIRMRSRMGRYITFDEVIDESVRRAYEEVSKRSPHLSEEEKKNISNIVGIGAVKYALVEVDPTKPVVFTWDRVLNFEKNSAPYIQYSHARACSIIRKASREPKKPDYSLLKEPLERDLIIMLSRFPEVFIEVTENLKPNLIADFANSLSDKFNTFYNALPVIKAKPQGLSDARLMLVYAVKTVLSNALALLGIEAPERM
jgi:arginyl-tRNA synthetase